MSMRNVRLPDGKLRQAQGHPRRHTGAQAKRRAFERSLLRSERHPRQRARPGSCNYLHGPAIGQTRHCPVLALHNWIAISGIKAGSVFRPVDRHGRVASERLSGEAVSLVVKERVAAAGIDPNGFSGDSLPASPQVPSKGASRRSRLGRRPAMPATPYSCIASGAANCSSIVPLARCFDARSERARLSNSIAHPPSFC